MWVVRRVQLALHRSRRAIMASAITYITFAVLGAALATAGWPFAVARRDAVVEGARASSVTIAYHDGRRLQAALLDFASNAVIGALPTSVAGLSVIGPFPIAAYRAWIGGVVSIDRDHKSRLATPPTAIYYLVTLTLQLLGYILTTAAGVHLGIGVWRARNDASVRSVVGLRFPHLALEDAAWLYGLALPIFLIGSLYEFLA